MSKKMIYTAPTGKKIVFDAYEKNTSVIKAEDKIISNS